MKTSDVEKGKASSKPVLILDVDGVLADFVTHVVNFLNEKAGTNFSHENVLSWKIEKIPEFAPYRKDMWDFITREGFCRELRPYPEALASFSELKTLAQIRILTSWVETSRTWTYDRMQWLKEHFNIQHKQVIFGYDKGPYYGDVFVDDKPQNIINWLKSQDQSGAKPGIGFLWARPWNQTFDSHPRLIRTADWGQVKEALKVRSS